MDIQVEGPILWNVWQSNTGSLQGSTTGRRRVSYLIQDHHHWDTGADLDFL